LIIVVISQCYASAVYAVVVCPSVSHHKTAKYRTTFEAPSLTNSKSITGGKI